MRRLLVKICGVTRPADAATCVAAGADAIGINLWPGSKRHVRLEEAHAILAAIPAGVLRIAVFVNAPADDLVSALAAGFDLVQLHGDEPPAFARDRRLARRCVRAHRVRGPESLAEAALAAWDGAGPFQILDAPAPGYGGGGVPFDWSLVAAASCRRIVLAGGLTPLNVAEAVRTVRPWGVDVASGVESEPGVKDAALVAAFVRAARAALEDDNDDDWVLH